ncbi:alkyl hydroperoxide reductase [Acetobacter sp. DsW_063]|nr:alkyl hydroperoxide reductase [Acetobacter sp. DsW_063]
MNAVANNQKDSTPSLNALFRELDAERRRTWAPEALAINVNQRATLRRDHGASPHVQIGDTLEPATLRNAAGESVSLDSLTEKGPAVIVLFRFATCPACNIALPYYRDTLWPSLQAAGVALAAVSPQPFPALNDIATAHALPFPVLSDPQLAFGRALGVTYQFDDASRAAAEAKGGTPHALNGVDVWELPKPAVLIISPDRKVLFADVSPDWMERTETSAILKALGLTPTEISHAA